MVKRRGRHLSWPPSPNYKTNGRTLELSTDLAYIAALHGDSTIWLVSTPILREDTGGSQGPPTSTPSTNHTRVLAARWLFRAPPCRKGTIHLQTSMPSPGFELGPYGTPVGIANYFTSWVTLHGVFSQIRFLLHVWW
ncbi:hypothetical protein TNCV_357941 [Trichonephila clavipes]|nr:hypothetical protein TNCV_357941 [Trichonephila clavipes]